MVGCVGDIPRRGEQQQAVALEILDDLSIARELELLNIEVLLVILNPANVLIRQVFADDLNVILVLQTVLEHLKLQHADNADDNRFHTGIRLAEDLDGALLCDLLDTLDELLALERVLLTDNGKQLGCERRDAGEHALMLGIAHGITDGEHARIENTDNIARIRLIDNGAVLCHQLLRCGKHHLLAGLNVQHVLTALKLAGANTHERNTVAVRLVHVRLNLEHKRGEMRVERVDHTDVSGTRGRRRRHLQELFQERLNAEVSQRGTEEHRRQLALVHSLEIKLVACTGEQLHIVDQRLVLILGQQSLEDRIVDRQAPRLDLVAEIRALKRDNLIVHAVVHALEALARADRPVYRIGADAQLVLDVLEQLVRVACLTVHLVDKGEDGHTAHRTNLKQLAGLRLDALGGVNDHHRRVSRHQRAVGILREVLMTRGIQNVDALTLIAELQHRGRYRNTALLLDLHPVGNRMTAVFLALDHAGLLNGSAVEQKLLCDGGFTGVRVRNDCKCAPIFNFFFQVCHRLFPPDLSKI